MDGIEGVGGRTLATKPDQHIVGRRADLTRKAISPLMKRSFTRRIVLFAYQRVLPRPELPENLGVRPTPYYEPLASTRWIPEETSEFRGSGARPELLRDIQTGELAIFKSGETSNLTVPTQGIDGPSQPLRARAASLVAERIFGIATPTVKLVQYRGVKGSLQSVIPNAIDLSKLYQRDPEFFATMVDSREFAEQRADLWMFEYTVGNVDPQSHNILTTDPHKVPGTKQVLMPIDQDLTFPPVRQYRTLFGVKSYQPCRVNRETYEKLKIVLEQPQDLRELVDGLLTEPEIAAMFVRMSDVVAIVDNTVAQRGEEGAFF